MWQSLTEPQALIISSCITVLAAIIGVSLGSWLFGGRVRDLQSALDASKAAVAEHRADVDKSFGDIRARLGELETLFGTAIEGLGQVRGSLGDLSASRTEEGVNDIAGGEAIVDQDYREQLRTAWEQIRDTLETIAADPSVDGRTRGKYARIDRRNYHWLIDSLDFDRRLQGAGERFREAVTLWHRFRPNRIRLERADAERMASLRDELVRLSPAEDAA